MAGPRSESPLPVCLSASKPLPAPAAPTLVSARAGLLGRAVETGMLGCSCSAACSRLSLQCGAFRFPGPLDEPNHSIIPLGYEISRRIIFYLYFLIANSHVLLLPSSNRASQHPPSAYLRATCSPPGPFSSQQSQLLSPGPSRAARRPLLTSTAGPSGTRASSAPGPASPVPAAAPHHRPARVCRPSTKK